LKVNKIITVDVSLLYDWLTDCVQRYRSGHHHHHLIIGQVAQAKPRLGSAAGTPDRRSEKTEKKTRKPFLRQRRQHHEDDLCGWTGAGYVSNCIRHV